MKSQKVSIIIPFYNRIAMTRDCLKGIFNIVPHSEPSSSYEVILIDDASEEKNSFDEEISRYSGIKLLRNDTNLGFARSCNRGAAATDSQYLVFLNNDTIPLDNWLSNLLKVFETEQGVGIVGSKLLYPDDTIQHAGVVFDEDKQPFHIYHRFPVLFAGANKIRDFQAVTGACFMIEAALFSWLGGFDESYLNGFEDMDLCCKVREAGRRVVYTPLSCLYHLESQTRKASGSRQNNNLALFKEQWGGKIDSDFGRYYQEDLAHEKNLPPFLAKLLDLTRDHPKPLIAVWGAGSAGHHMLDMLKFVGVSPDFIVDNDSHKWGSYFDGFLIHDPEFLQELKLKNQPVLIVIASLYFQEIRAQLEQMGLEIGRNFFC